MKVPLGWLSASKKSGLRRCPISCSSGTSTLATSIEPSIASMPLSPTVIVAVEVTEAAAEGGDAEVLDLEADLGVDGVDAVGTGFDSYCLFGGAHFVSLRRLDC